MIPRNLPRRSLLAAGLAVGAGVSVAGPTTAAPAAPAASGGPGADAAPDDPAGALARLLAGNRRFASGRARQPRQTLADLRRVAGGQHPVAITFGCADSRVAPELLFDQGLGDIFDNRVAGNIVDDLLLGSTEFAVEEFAPRVVVVLGHERCGAITATIEAIETGAQAPGHIGAIVDALRPIVEPVLDQPGDPVENAVRANVRAQARHLLERSRILREKARAGELAVVGARYDLDTGTVTVIR